MTEETKSQNALPEEPAKRAAKPTRLGAIRAAFLNWEDSGGTGFEQKSSNELAEIRTDLAISRNLMAADRTLMAWIRTALSMNSFGFTIYKLLETYQQSGAHLPEGHTPRNIGLFLTGMGTFAMVLGVIEYWLTLRELHTLKELRLARPTLIMGLLMAAMGLFLFFAIITRLF
jgi:putative membrane protein